MFRIAAFLSLAATAATADPLVSSVDDLSPALFKERIEAAATPEYATVLQSLANRYFPEDFEEIVVVAASNETNADRAFVRFIGSYSIKGSYPEKQAAMDSAVGALGEDAPVADLLKVATEAL